MPNILALLPRDLRPATWLPCSPPAGLRLDADQLDAMWDALDDCAEALLDLAESCHACQVLPDLCPSCQLLCDRAFHIRQLAAGMLADSQPDQPCGWLAERPHNSQPAASYQPHVPAADQPAEVIA